jgi:pectate lyase
MPDDRISVLENIDVFVIPPGGEEVVMRWSVPVVLLVACSPSPAPSGPDGVLAEDPDAAAAGDDAPPADAPPADALPGAEPDAATAGEDCTSYPFQASTLYAERVGFGRNTTGGDWSQPYHVTTLADAGAGSLRAALESDAPYWIVFDVDGVIDLADDLEITSNKTVDGRGRDITIDGNLEIDPGTHDVILSDVTLQYPEGFETSDGDLISIRGHGGTDPEAYDTRDLWFHHLELARGGDGQIDNRGATYLTISWSYFHSHAKAMLHANDTDQNPSPGNRSTYHHNFFAQVSRRGPQFHWGYADFFNNLQYQWYEYGAASLDGAQFRSEANIYEARPGAFCLDCPDPNSPTGDMDFVVSKVALTTDWGSEPGLVASVGDVVRQDAVITQRMPELVFERADHYTAVVDPADAALETRLRAETGPRRSYCQ